MIRRKTRRGGYKTYRYEALEPLLHSAFNAATSHYKRVTPDVVNDIKNHMYETVVSKLNKDTAHDNSTVRPAINTYIRAKLAAYNAYTATNNSPANTYKRMVYEGQLGRELSGVNKTRRGGKRLATRKRRATRKRA